jgi:sortase A
MRKVVQWVCLLAGVALLGLYGGLRFDALRANQAALDRFATARNDLAKASAAASTGAFVARAMLPMDFDYDRSLWAADRIAEYEESRRHEFAPPLAVLTIPDIDLQVAVLPGTDELTLNRAVGHIPGTAVPGEIGNVALAGHRDGFFRGLKDIEVGDRIELETLHERMEYTIEGLQLVDPSNVSVLDPTPEPTLTLVTCYPFYYIGKAPLRFIVRASASRTLAEMVASGSSKSAPPRPIAASPVDFVQSSK